jgi:drug/metabolite transporter (DMT)-like permease
VLGSAAGNRVLHGVCPSHRGMLLILLGVGVTTHLGQVFMTRGLHLERAGRATAAGLVQIVFAASGARWSSPPA